LALATGIAKAQRLQRFGLEEGLPQSTVNCIAQDKKGFLWVGTQDGLARFDGRSFRVVGKEEGISTSFITCIMEDQEQYLWVGTLEGLFMLTPNRLEAIEFKHENNNPSSLSSSYIHCLYQDAEGAVWVGTNNGLDRFDRSLKKFSHTGKFNVQTIAQGLGNKVWLGTANGMLLFDTKQNKVLHTYQYSFTDANSLKNNIVLSILPSGRRLYVGTEGGFCWLDTTTQRFHRLKGQDRTTQSIYQLMHGSVLVATLGSGLLQVDEQTQSVVPFGNEFFTTNRIKFLFKDNQEGLWIGSDDGLYLYHRLNQFFHLVNVSTMVSGHSLGPNVFSLASSNDSMVWIGYENDGVARFHEKTHQLELVPALPKKSAHYLHADKKNLWVGFLGNAITQFNLKSDTYQEHHFPRFNPNRESSNNQITAIEKKSENELWVALAPVGLLNYNKLTQQVDAITNAALGIKSEDLSIVGIKQISDLLWLSTMDKGLIAWNEKKQTVMHYGKNSGLPCERVVNLTKDQQDQLWVSTDEGLAKFQPVAQTYQLFTKQQGLPANTIYSMLEDKKGNLWLATNNGLCRFTPPRGTTKAEVLNFDVKDGLPSREFNQAAATVGASGHFYFGGTNGVVYFHPDSLLHNSFEPPIAITDFHIFGKPAPTLYTDSLITLPYNQNFFSFSFAALSFYRADKNQYAFRLEGLDNDWVFAGTENKANYTFVPPGNYTFRVKATNNEGLWSSKMVAIKVIVLPPWWRTWWAYTVYGVSLIFTLILVIRRRTQQLKRQNLLLEKKVAERTDQLEETNQELVSTMENLKATQQQLIESEKMASLGLLTAGIAHEINNPLNFISSGAQGLKEVLAESKELAQVDEATKSEVATLLQCVDVGVERAANIVKSLRLFVSPQQSAQEMTETDLEACVESSLTLLGAKITEHRIQVVKNYASVKPVRGNSAQLSQVVVNLLDNAMYACAKVERQRVITLIIEQVQNNVVLTIADNGIGIPKPNQREIFTPFFTTKEVGLGTGLGLYISYGIIKNHHGQITFTSTEGQGTEFKVVL
jgi:signal transduction histidine kinase/ligand-binding sensor domain-containing protein